MLHLFSAHLQRHEPGRPLGSPLLACAVAWLLLGGCERIPEVEPRQALGDAWVSPAQPYNQTLDGGIPWDAAGIDVVGLPDAQADATLPDSTLPDSKLPDSTQPDSALPDSTLPDSTVADSLTAGLALADANAQQLREGSEATLRQLKSALERHKVIEINPAAGAKFDPHQHQAISVVPAQQEPNTVVMVLQKGYLIAERVLRPALVTVTAPK